VLRFAFFLLLCASISGATTGFAQDSSSTSGAQPSGITQTEPGVQSPSAQVLAAETAIAASDWKTAEAKLDPWLATHPNDARSLFDAGYVADAQNRLDDAATLYRRATAANPKSFEAHLSLGLLLARKGKPAEAQPELLAATKLDPGEAGSALKARAWRALAAIDRPDPSSPGDTTAASNDLLEALKLSPETSADTLLAASLAEQASEFDAAESAYRRVLLKDPKSEPANAGLAHLLIRKKQYPENTAISSMLAQVLAEAGDSAGSDQLYLKLLAATPNDPDLLVAHGQNLVRLGRFPEALAQFGKATQIDPTNTDAWSGIAFAASRTNQPAVTLHALTMRSKYLPESASTYFLWATSYDSLHQTGQAAVYYHHFLDSSAGKFPNQEWQARQRLQVLEKKQ